MGPNVHGLIHGKDWWTVAIRPIPQSRSDGFVSRVLEGLLVPRQQLV
jgi:hypothetical protein